MKQLISQAISFTACIVWDYFLLTKISEILVARGNWMWALLLMFLIIPKQPNIAYFKIKDRIVTRLTYEEITEEDEDE